MGYCIERSWSPAMIGMFGADAQGQRKGGKVPREGGGVNMAAWRLARVQSGGRL